MVRIPPTEAKSKKISKNSKKEKMDILEHFRPLCGNLRQIKLILGS